MGNLPRTSTAESECPMTGASKILTVSYGTFSCTLEGFDDPFNTMKAIAEYFRDLAAEDRYFGAEPPTPDAAMLHRIAEREIQRRVEAKIQDNGVILRAGDGDAAPSLPAPVAVAPSVAAPTVVAPSLAAEASQVVADAPLPMEGTETAAESVAARLQRIRARHAAQAAPEDVPVVVTTPVAAVVVDVPAIAPVSLDASYTEDEHAEPLPAEVAADSAAIETFDHIESLSDVTAADAAPVESVTEVPFLDLAGLDLSDDFADLPEAEDFDQTLLVEAGSAPLEGFEDAAQDNDAVLASLAETLAAEPAAEEPAPFVAPLAVTDDAAPDGILLDDAAAPDEGALLSRLSGMTAEPATPQPEPPSEVIEPIDQPAPETEAPKAQRARARVIRVRRAETPTDDAKPAAPAAPSATYAALQQTALSDEAEAALQAELAALEAEHDTAGATTDGSEADAPEQDSHATSPTAEPRPNAPIPSEDDAVNRLIAHANSEMDGEETRRRQSAIAHLKAAAAATAADRGVQDGSASETTRMEAYRDDLDRVVRPRRPVSDGLGGPRPSTDAEPLQRPTPLVLVSAQRIDRATTDDAPRVVTPVRPRRVSPAASDSVLMQNTDQAADDFDDLLSADEAENLFADATSFQEFADQLGVTALPDLLEAAAVYCAEVLQRPEFSRPLVMRQIAGLPGQTETAREDYLRGFGTLLRQGRIAKVKRGMFALTDRSPYLAEARKQVG